MTRLKQYLIVSAICYVVPTMLSAQDIWYGGRAAGGMLSSQEVPTKDAYSFAALAGARKGRAGITVSTDFISIRKSPDGNGRYYVDTFSSGGSACRDRITGQFADSELCGSRNVNFFSPSAYASYRISKDSSIAIGLGGRIGKSSGPIFLIYKYVADGFVGAEVGSRGVMAFVSFILKR